MTTTSQTSTSSVITTTVPQPLENALGDVNNDDLVNSVDASLILAYYAKVSTNAETNFTESQKIAADVNNDGLVNSVDASNVLQYYAYASTTKDEVLPMAEFQEQKKKK